MNTIFLHRNGHTEQATRIDRGWLNPISGASLWIDLTAPSIPESLILSDTLQCPTCNHVLKAEAAHLGSDLPAITRASADAIACPDCGEMVRKGLVRCCRLILR